MGVAWDQGYPDSLAHAEVPDMSMLCQGILVMPLESGLVIFTDYTQNS